MRKVQKTVMVHEDLYRLITHIEKTSGASCTRTMLAALAQYFFSEPYGPDPEWMKYIVSLELGEIRVAEIPLQRQQDAAAEALAYAETIASDPNTPKLSIDQARARAYELRQLWTHWKRLLDQPGDDGIAKIIGYWSKSRTPTIPTEAPTPRPPALTPETHPDLFEKDKEGRQVINWQHNDAAPPDADPPETES